jgi:hypothetical protein
MNDDFEWILELAFWWFAPVILILIVVAIDIANWPWDLGLI